MTRVAITGHRGLPDMVTTLVDAALRDEIRKRAEASALIGLSCVADGADALFAIAVLDHGGSLHVLVPARKFREGLPANHHATYDALLSEATEVIHLDHAESDPPAHMDASLRMLSDADELLAVWDGQPARDYGGTADVVEEARRRDIPVTVIWPAGATRD